MRRQGTIRDEPPVVIFTLGSVESLQARVTNLGGTLVSLSLPVEGRRVPLILTLSDLDAWRRDRNYMSQLVGRYANRISNARFELDGKTYPLTSNDGKHSLHGGDAPFGREVWRTVSVREGEGGFVRLAHVSPDGAGGFPGNLEVSAVISVTGNTLRLDFEAVSDASTPINFTWHPYFNLSGRADSPITNHQLRIAAGSYLSVDSSWIPTGEVAPVGGTRFDYRTFKQVGYGGQIASGSAATPLNHCFVIDRSSPVIAEVFCPETGIRMEVRSDLPGIQVYDGYFVGEQYPGWHGLALEPGGFPDAPNRPGFPDCILRPSVKHRSFMSYTFFREASAAPPS